MKEKLLRSKEKSACSAKNMSIPELVSCPGCGEELEFWTDEQEITCKKCGHSLTRMVEATCCQGAAKPLDKDSAVA